MRKGRAVVRYRCAAPVTEACHRRLQRRRCDIEWLLMGVISREDPLYFELRHQGRPSEGAHTNTRTRTGQAGKDLTSRPKRIGIPFMAYRAAVGGFLDVFRLCLWHGWLGSHPKPHPVKIRRRSGEIAVATLQAARAKFGALLPRGKAAQKLGLVFQGIVPDGYTTIAQRKEDKAAAAKKAAKEKQAAKEKAATEKAAKGKQAEPPPDAAAA